MVERGAECGGAEELQAASCKTLCGYPFRKLGLLNSGNYDRVNLSQLEAKSSRLFSLTWRPAGARRFKFPCGLSHCY